MKLTFLVCLLLNIKLAYSLVWIGDFAKFSTWKIEHSYNDANRQVVNDPKGGNDKVLRVKYPAGSVSNKPGLMKGGTGFYVYPFGGQQVLHAVFEYDVLFPKDFDFVKGGKLPGMFGGRISPSCSGGDDARDCFTARFMFDQDAGGYSYLYVSKTANHSKEFCVMTKSPNCAPQYGYGFAGAKPYFTRDKWIHMKELIKLNSPGQQNGRFAVWVDGNQKVDFNKMVFRTNNVPISGFVFETFFGGQGSDWESSKEQYAYFKNLRIETL